MNVILKKKKKFILRTGVALKDWEEILLVSRNRSYKSFVGQQKVSSHKPTGLITTLRKLIDT